MSKKIRTSPAKPAADLAPKQPARRRWTGMAVLLAVILALVLVFQGGSEAQAVPRYRFEVVRKIPHDTKAFTEGLIYHEGFFYESTGQYGSSSVRRMDAQTGTVLEKHDLEATYFGEGLTFYRGVLVQLTWHEKKAFVYDSTTLAPLREYPIDTEGWGLTHDGTHYVMSDGSSFLSFRDSELKQVSRLEVTLQDKPLKNINELEYIEGEIWANVWKTWEIVRISPQTGKVMSRIDLKGIIDAADLHGQEDFLNGIAYDPARKAVYVTGKNFAYIYEITLKPITS